MALFPSSWGVKRHFRNAIDRKSDSRPQLTIPMIAKSLAPFEFSWLDNVQWIRSTDGTTTSV